MFIAATILIGCLGLFYVRKRQARKKAQGATS
ncbi:hypothetical protein BH18ACI5_BH18ACI5_21320 [soil metagenome]